MQERSRERVERILAATEALIIEVGVNNLRINEIAARAQIPAGSIYQYFPDLEAIVHNLVDRYHRHFKKLADTQFLNIRSVGEFTEKHIAMLEDASRFLRETPGYRELWCGAQGWPPLREMDWLDTRYNAERITDALHRLLPNLDRNEILATCMVTLDAARSVVLMALYFEDEYDLIWQQYKSMVISHITSLTRKSLHPPAAP